MAMPSYSVAEAKNNLPRLLDRMLTDKARCRVDDEGIDRDRRLMRHGVPLRTPDALHLALVMRDGRRLAALDRDLGGAAARMGVVVVSP